MPASHAGARLLSILALTMAMQPLRAAEPPCSLSPADAAAVVTAMKTMYDGATRDDRALVHSVVEPDFDAFDGGREFQGDALFETVRSYHQKGVKFVWNVTDPHVKGTCHVAWIRYVNRGSVEDASGRHEMSWLESAVLRKATSGWKIAFFHSTQSAK